VLGVLGVLLLIEMTVDKIPAVDTVNDVIHTVVRPAAGAVLFASSSNVISDVNPALAMICGLLMAGGVHAAKATARPVITATTAGLGNPVVSLLEDVVSAITAIVSIVLPAVACGGDPGRAGAVRLVVLPAAPAVERGVKRTADRSYTTNASEEANR